MMSHSGLNRGVAARRAVDHQFGASRRRNSRVARRDELEAKLAALQKDYADLHAAIFEASQVHRRLCAPRLVRYGNFEIASEIFAVRHLAGDFFTTQTVGSSVVLALADISGKGLAAGMWTTHLVGRVGARAAVHAEPEWIVSGVNRDVCLIGSSTPLASLFVAKIDPVTGKVDYCSAGHPPALLLRANGNLELLSDGGLLLGVVPNAPYLRGSIELGFGDVLLAYSDGVVESLNRGEEEFGMERLEKQLRRARDGSAESILFSVLAAVQDFAAPRPLVDDMSLVIVRRVTH